MKTQIIQLEPHDDAISVRDKMGWAQTGRVVLVWPPRSRGQGRARVMTRRLDLVLLSRHSQALGGQLALVTSDGRVRENARLLGIPIFQSAGKAQESRWKRPPRKRHLESFKGNGTEVPLPSESSEGIGTEVSIPSESSEGIGITASSPENPDRLSRRNPPSRAVGTTGTAGIAPAFRVAIFALGVLAVLSIASAIFPSAEIGLSPQTEEQEITLALTATENANSVNLSGILPLRTTSTIVEGRSSTPATGETNFPLLPAEGMVTFTNLTDRSISIPAGTVVSNASGAARFATAKISNLRAGPGTTVAVPVTAILPGSSGNLSTGRIQAIEGELGVFLAATNLEPLSGGTDAASPAASSADRSMLRQNLIATLERTATEEIQRSLDAGDVLLNAGSPELANVLEESYDPQGEQPTSELKLSLRLEYLAYVVTGEDLTTLAQAVLEANLPDGYEALPGTLEIEHLTEPQFRDSTTANWRIRASRKIQASPDLDAARRVTLGQTPARAIQLLVESETLPLSEPPQVELHPGWWPLLPFLPFRITIYHQSLD